MRRACSQTPRHAARKKQFATVECPAKPAPWVRLPAAGHRPCWKILEATWPPMSCTAPMASCLPPKQAAEKTAGRGSRQYAAPCNHLIIVSNEVIPAGRTMPGRQTYYLQALCACVNIARCRQSRRASAAWCGEPAGVLQKEGNAHEQSFADDRRGICPWYLGCAGARSLDWNEKNMRYSL